MSENSMDFIVSYCKRRGFVFPSSEIYGGFSAIYDYGHYGNLLKENIKNAWFKYMVQYRDDVISLDSAIFMHPKTWVASGHVGGFNDPQVDCKTCHYRMRADHMLEKFGINADKAPIDEINVELDKLKAEGKLSCPNCGGKDLTEAKVFSLMVKSNIGSPTDTLSEENVVYLRPETCGGIYLEYKNTMDNIHPKMPFGVAQIGKAFRNEIVARQFIFRTREFEQMEMQYFHNPKDTKEIFENWRKTRWAWFLEYGIPEEKIRWYKHEKLAHYASDAYDIEYNYNCMGGFKEVEGIHARGNWDLSQHSKFSGEKLEYFDQVSGERYIPHIVETSVGLGRLFLMFIDNALVEEKFTDEEGKESSRTVLKIHKELAPIKIAIFPLLKNKEELQRGAREVFDTLKKKFVCEFDDNGNVGKRYRRQDEIGTPYCVTFDFDSLEDNSVTVRDRDTMKQERVKVSELKQYFIEKFEN